MLSSHIAKHIAALPLPLLPPSDDTPHQTAPRPSRRLASARRRPAAEPAGGSSPVRPASAQPTSTSPTATEGATPTIFGYELDPEPADKYLIHPPSTAATPEPPVLSDRFLAPPPFEPLPKMQLRLTMCAREAATAPLQTRISLVSRCARCLILTQAASCTVLLCSLMFSGLARPPPTSHRLPPTSSDLGRPPPMTSCVLARRYVLEAASAIKAPELACLFVLLLNLDRALPAKAATSAASPSVTIKGSLGARQPGKSTGGASAAPGGTDDRVTSAEGGGDGGLISGAAAIATMGPKAVLGQISRGDVQVDARPLSTADASGDGGVASGGDGSDGGGGRGAAHKGDADSHPIRPFTARCAHRRRGCQGEARGHQRRGALRRPGAHACAPSRP